jgi:glycosyltransferase involved in cell wall biosynthesis
VRVPIEAVPPPLAACRIPVKTTWRASSPFRFLSIGEAHFRKGVHLLLAGFMQAFPAEGEATLTVKVPAGCGWQSPRADITILAGRLDRKDLLTLYRAHDAYVTASLGEGLGLPVGEAVMAMLPVVINWWGGHCDIVQPSHCWPIAHDVVPQPFCSDPSYYAPGQRCAYSSPERIAVALRTVFEASSDERQARSLRAKAALDQSHGTTRIAALVRQHQHAVLGALPRIPAKAASR